MVAALALVVGACSGSNDAPTTIASPDVGQPAGTTTTVETTTTTDGSGVDVQDRIGWFLSVLNGEQIDQDEYDSRFSEEFRRQVPFNESFLPLLDQLRGDAPYEIVERSGEGAAGEVVVTSASAERFRIVAELTDDGRFAGLLIQPADGPSLENPPASIADAFDRLGDMGTLRAITAEVAEGSCVAIEHVEATSPAPIGSIFKLYVLAAIGDAVSDGTLEWNDEMVIHERLKSVPTGVLQDRPDGDRVSVLEAAELMISISDNTATDHLIDLLGREVVEETIEEYGNTTAELNTPLLTTRELTALKVGVASGLRGQWLEADDEERRGILDQISDITPDDLPIRDWTNPVDPHLVEWFATPADLCTLAVRLMELAERVPEIDSILSINPGVPASAPWDLLWFKGGAEPGLVATWFVTRAEGRTFVTAGSVVNPDQAIDNQEAILLLAAIRDLTTP